jgi:hypothetical protein
MKFGTEIYGVSMKSLHNFKNLLQRLDFFLWCYVKDIVYQTKVREVTNLKQRITDAIATIDEGMLQRTWQEIEYRLDMIRASNGEVKNTWICKSAPPYAFMA